MEMPVWVLLTVLVLIALAAPRYGVDSRNLRPGEGPHRRGPTPWGDALAVVRAAGRRMLRAATR